MFVQDFSTDIDACFRIKGGVKMLPGVFYRLVHA